MTNLLKTIGLIIVGLLAVKLLGVVFSLIFGIVGTAFKLISYLIVGALAVFIIKKFIFTEKR